MPQGRRRHRHQLELLVLAALGGLGVWLAVQPVGPTPVRELVVSPLVLLLPGLAVTEATFLPGTLNATRRLVLGIGASLALSVLVGLVLNLLPPGLTVQRWAAALGILTAAGASVAVVRRLAWRRRARRGDGPESTAGPGGRSDQTREVPAATGQAATQNGASNGSAPSRRARAVSSSAALAVAAVVVVALVTTAFVVARRGVASQERQVSFTQLWMVPAGSAQPGSVSLGVTNKEARAETYLIVLRAAGTTIWTSPTLTLDSGQRWESSVSITPALAAGAASPPLVAQLFRPGSSAAYRHVDAPAGWLQVSPSP